MARILGGATVVGGADGNDAAIAGERNAVAAFIAGAFSIDVGAELGEGHRYVSSRRAS